jgi:hypothetical protein
VNVQSYDLFGLAYLRVDQAVTACKEAGYMTRQPHYNSIFAYCAKPELTPAIRLDLSLSVVAVGLADTGRNFDGGRVDVRAEVAS